MKTTFLLLILGLSSIVLGQSYNNGNITAQSTDCSVANSCVMLGLLNDDSAAAIIVTGTFSATLQFEISADYHCTQVGVCSGTWTSKQCFPTSSSTGATSTTAAGTWSCSVAAMNQIRVRSSTYASGTAAIELRHSKASASLNQGGSGSGGTPGGSDTQLQYNNASAFGGTANGTFNNSTGVFSYSQKADGNDLLFGSRFTDTTPSGNFIHFQNAAKNADLYKVTAAGNPVLGAGGNISSSDTGSPGFTFSTNLETANQPLAIAGDGVHAAAIGLLGNTTVPSLTANSFHWLGPNSASFTAWGVQMASAENASAGILHLGAASSHVSQGTVSAVVAADTDSSIAHTGVDVNTSYQVTATHLAAALPVAQGGTALASGTSGGILGYTATGTLASSVLLGANLYVKGGGAGATPVPGLTTDDGTTSTYTGTGGTKSPVFTSTGTTAGFVALPQGTTSAAVAPCNTANTICEQAPTAVTSYLVTRAGAAATGIPHYANSASVITETISAIDLSTADATGTLAAARMPALTGDCTTSAGAVATTCTKINGIGIQRVTMVADWTCGTAGTSSSCTAATIVGTNGTPLTITLPSVAASYHWQCDGVVGQATAATANSWNVITATNAPTNLEATYQMNTAAAAMAGGALTGTSSTSTSVIGAAWTLGGTATKMPFHIQGSIEGASASGTVVSLQLVAPTVADLVTVYRGATCSVTPF